MSDIFFIPVLIGYCLALILTFYTSFHIFKNHKAYGTKLMAALNLLAVITIGGLYSTFFIISIIIFPSILIWILSLICSYFILGITALIYSFIYEYKKLPLFPIIVYAIILGFNIGFLFLSDSIRLENNSKSKFFFIFTDISNINYVFNLFTGSIVILFYLFSLMYILFYSIKIYKKSRKKDLAYGLIINTLTFTIMIYMFVFYIYFKSYIFRDIYIILLWINFSGVASILIKKPELFLDITNRIHYISIYHKSGVLLFSYKFEKEKNYTDSPIWGNIIIGINYILSEFIDKEDKIDVMQTKTSEIVVNYNTEFGFALVAIIDKKTDIIENLMRQFMNNFTRRYSKELFEMQDLNKIINITEFEDTKKIIEQVFNIYL